MLARPTFASSRRQKKESNEQEVKSSDIEKSFALVQLQAKLKEISTGKAPSSRSKSDVVSFKPYVVPRKPEPKDGKMVTNTGIVKRKSFQPSGEPTHKEKIIRKLNEYKKSAASDVIPVGRQLKPNLLPSSPSNYDDYY
jgi:hypothetical protein